MENFEKRFKKLNKEQKKAVNSIEGPVLVVAGPGSGKTEILSLRAVNILKETDVFPRNILCLTFTDSAAVNMRERLKSMIGEDAYKVAVHTFHSFGESIKNRHPEVFHKGAVFNSIDDLAQMSLVDEILDGLEYDNPLKVTHSGQGYIFSKPVIRGVQYLKKAGITPDEFFKILEHNEEVIEELNSLVDDVFSNRVSKKIFDKVADLLKKIKDLNMRDFPVDHMSSLDKALENSLGRALGKSVEEDRTSYLSEWKKENTYKNKEGKRLLKAEKYLEKMEALAEVYEEYQDKMYERGYYDFDDMILDVIQAIERNDELRYELQEQFLYIMVDEFQDTNDAQMRLIYLLTGAEVNEKRPNIMVVGDDDQAIFKFQGAKISNIFRFKDRYRDPEIVTLTKNYRSHQSILDIARGIILQGDERLENVVEDINKELEAKKDKGGEVVAKHFSTRSHEYYWLAEEINRLISEGKSPEEIAVISRNHKYLKEVVSYLNQFEIPINYEKQRDILEDPHIKQLIKIARFVDSLIDPDKEDADYLLPEILSYPFWGVDKELVWKISREAYNSRRDWLSCMKESDNSKIRKVADFLVDLSVYAKHQRLEKILDKMIGNEEKSKDSFISPFKEYYFSNKNFEENPTKYIIFLSGLRTFIHSLREYKKGEEIGLSDLIDFVEIHKDNNKSLTDNSVFVNSHDAVRLLSVHKAKGMEFDTVFVISCQDKIWARKGWGSKLPFPKNLPIKPAGDNRDDQLRLFYVALTRAANNLYLTSYEFDDSGDKVSRLEFLEGLEEKEETDLSKEVIKVSEVDKEKEILSSWDDFDLSSLSGGEEALLENILKDYKLNATHLNKFLNVVDGGPKKFFEENLLRFPQPKTPSLSYGTSMHRTVHKVYTFLKNKGELPSVSKVLGWFEDFLSMERLDENNFDNYLNRGKDALSIFYKKRKDEFKKDHFSEFNFWDQGVVFDEVPLSGKVDKIVLDDEEAFVVDFKTGSAVDNWKGKGKYEKIKLWKYKNQLIFYKILLENSRDFEDYIVKQGELEFLEPVDNEVINLSLRIEKEDVERVKELIAKVYKMIVSLDFPDVEEYKNSLKGIKEFEKTLLS